MPGIAGIIDPSLTTNQPERLEQLDKMCCPIKHYGWYRLETYVRGPLALGHVDHGIFRRDLQPVNSNDGRYTLFFHGEVYNYEELEKQIGIQESLSTSKLLLALYEKYENNFVLRLKGAFNIVIWDWKERKLIVVNDRYGLRPIYYSQHNKELYLGSEVKAILACDDVSKNIDDSAIASLFFFGFVIGNKTYFKSIRLLPPASFLVFKNNEVTISNYWHFNFLDKKEGKPQDYYEERLGKLILEAVERHVKDNVRITVPLSGGLDSRTILASVGKEYYPINTVTFGTKDMDDVRIAKRVSDTLGTKHRFLEILPNNIISYAKEIVNITDGMISFLHSVGNMKLELIKDYTDVCLDGMKVIGSFFSPVDILLGKEGLLASNLFQPVAPNLTRSIFADFYYEKIRDCPGEIIRNICQKCKSVSVTNILDYYNLTERQRRFINYGNLVKRVRVEIRSPFFDNDLVEFIVNTPPRERRYQYLYTRTFSRLFPELSRIPWEKTGLPIDATDTYAKMTLSLIKKRLKKRISMFDRMLTDNKYSEASSINLFTKYTQWSRENENLISFIRKTLLDGKAYSRSILNIKTVERILQEHIRGKCNHIELISRLLTFELWSQLFIN